MPKQIQSLERGLYILNSILLSPQPVSSSELARRLGVHKSTLSHLTTTLIEHGLLEKEAGSAKLCNRCVRPLKLGKSVAVLFGVRVVEWLDCFVLKGRLAGQCSQVAGGVEKVEAVGAHAAYVGVFGKAQGQKKRECQ